MRTAVWQARTGIDPDANANAVVAAIAQAATQGADMLFTPEMIGCLDRDRQRAAPRLRDERGDVVLAAIRQAAAEHAIWVHVGSLGLTGERSDGRLVNRSFIVGPDGEIRARYDKMHLFDVALPGGNTWRESAAYGPGERMVAVDTPWARMGLSICYDLRFPALYAALAEARAALLLVPAAFTVPTGQAHWHVLLRARAIESTCFVIAPAQCGQHEDGRATYGHSLIVDPWGNVLLDMGEEPGVACIDLDLNAIGELRGKLPNLANRRPLPDEVVIA